MAVTYDVPTCLDELVPFCRRIIEKVRTDYGNPADFEFYIGTVLREALAGHAPEARAFTLRALGLED